MAIWVPQTRETFGHPRDPGAEPVTQEKLFLIHQETGNTHLRWIDSSLESIVKAVRGGKSTASEILEEFITQIERYNASINALVIVDIEGARAQARRIDERRSLGEPLGLLAGVPLSIKEAFAVESMPTTCGFERYINQIPTFDAPVVQALRKTDAVIIGKSNVPTSLSGFGCKNPIYGQTSNPWSREHTPGGSSGGSGASIASSFSVLDLASDLSGSIRIPSSWCGVSGLRPSPGKLSKRAHLPWPLDTVIEPPESVPGFIAATAGDLAHAWNAVQSVTSTPVRSQKMLKLKGAGTKELRIGFWLPSEILRVSGEVVAALANLKDTLSNQGHIIENYRPPFDEKEVVQLARRLTDSEITFGLSEDTWASWNHEAFTTRSYLQDLNAIAALRHRVDRDLERFDVLLCPATPIVAPKTTDVDEDKKIISIDEDYVEMRSLADWSLVTSIVQLPSVTMPVGLSQDKLPIGVQVVGRNGKDFEVLNAAQEVELAIGSIGKPDLATTA